MAARKSTRKAAAKKKATKKSARKKSVGKKATRKKAAKKKSARKKKAARRSTVDLVGSELPKSLKAFGRQCRRDLSAIEKQIEGAGKDTRRSLARIVRDASHQLGTLEARGEKEWRRLSRNAKRDIERVIRRVQKATGS
jgi:hypothetical protein